MESLPFAVPVTPAVLLAVAGVALLLAGFASIGGVMRLVSGGATLLLAIGATAAAAGLFWLGHENDWTSDGPGMLFVMIAIVVCAVVAAFGWVLVFVVGTALASRGATGPDEPTAVRRTLRVLGVALLVLAAVVAAIAGRGRAAHASPVVAVSFATQRPRLVTADAGGTLVDWDLRTKREVGRQTRPELVGATEMFVDGSAGRGFAIANGKAVTFEPFRDTPASTIPGARHIARGSSVVVARDRALLFAPYSDWTGLDPTELAWPESIRAIAAGGMYVAVADRVRVSLLDGRRGSVRTLASVPAPGAISALTVSQYGFVLALDGSGAGWAIDVSRGVTEPLPATATLVASMRDVVLAGGGAVSLYDARKNAGTRMANIGSGARSLDTCGDHVALGFEDGRVVLGTRTGGKMETEELRSGG